MATKKDPAGADLPPKQSTEEHLEVALSKLAASQAMLEGLVRAVRWGSKEAREAKLKEAEDFLGGPVGPGEAA